MMIVCVRNLKVKTKVIQKKSERVKFKKKFFFEDDTKPRNMAATQNHFLLCDKGHKTKTNDTAFLSFY